MATSTLSRLCHHIGYTTQTADTPIVGLVPPKGNNYKTKITRIIYTPAGTVHDVVVMKALAKTTVLTAAADGATTLVLTDGAGGDEFLAAEALASGDYIVVQNDDGYYSYHLVSANTAGSLTINALPQAVSAGRPVWLFGAPDQSGTPSPHLTLKSIASTRIEWGCPEAGVAESGFETTVSNVTYSRSGFGDPMLVYSANATAAGFLHLVTATYHRLPQN